MQAQVQTAEERRARKRERARQYYLRNRAAIIARTTAYLAAHQEQKLATARSFYDRHRGAELHRATQYRRAHPLSVEERERRRLYGKAWRAAHPDHDRERYHSDPEYRTRTIQKVRKREARVAGGEVTHEEWTALLHAHDGKCYYCGEPATEMDHATPLSRGGEHRIGNILPACRSCNARKGAKTRDEWMEVSRG